MLIYKPENSINTIKSQKRKQYFLIIDDIL